MLFMLRWSDIPNGSEGTTEHHGVAVTWASHLRMATQNDMMSDTVDIATLMKENKNGRTGTVGYIKKEKSGERIERVDK